MIEIVAGIVAGIIVGAVVVALVLSLVLTIGFAAFGHRQAERRAARDLKGRLRNDNTVTRRILRTTLRTAQDGGDDQRYR
jgi:hypothetical protein